MKVLITGGTGFIGSWVIRYLLSLECNVVALVREDSSVVRLPTHQRLKIIRAHQQSHPDFLKSENPNVHISLDWDGVEGKFRNDSTQSRNVQRVIEMIEAGREVGISKFVGVGSQAEYGNPNRIINEDEDCNPTTEYGVAKYELCKQSESMLSKSFTTWTWVRIFSTYGPLDIGDWLINNAIDCFARNKDLDLTMCEQRWSYLYAADAARAIGTIALNQSSYGIYNLGHHHAPPLRDTIHLLKSLTNSSSTLNFGAVEYRYDQVMHLQPDTNKLQKLGWAPEVELEIGLANTLNWRLGKKLIDPFSGKFLPTFSEFS